jgi:hypothetical protein
MLGWWARMRWPMVAGLLALAFVALSVTPSQAHSVGQSGIPCLHQNEVSHVTPWLSSGTTQLPCDGCHCSHGPICCMSSCLAFASIVLPTNALVPAPLFYPADFPVPPPPQPNGFGVRPALPPPRIIV